MELALEMKEHIKRARAQTVLAEFPGPPVLLGGSQGTQERTASWIDAWVRGMSVNEKNSLKFNFPQTHRFPRNHTAAFGDPL